MPSPPLDTDVDDLAPTEPVLTDYDDEHMVTYLRMLDAVNEGADWREVARIVLHRDPDGAAERSWRAPREPPRTSPVDFELGMSALAKAG